MTAKKETQMIAKKKAERVVRTPAQRAEEELAIADRRVVKLSETCDRLRVEYEISIRDLAQARARREYAAANPDLAPTVLAAVPDDEAEVR